MCLGIPGRVVGRIEGQPELARVDVAGLVRAVNVGLLAPDLPEVGEWIVIHSGFAMDRIDEETAKRSLEFLMEYTA
jgi:hydrogenase expression/formation protein HypC